MAPGRESFSAHLACVLQRPAENLKDLYILRRQLGQGQFGTTYLCVEKATGKEYACKAISKRKLIAQEDIEDVRREIQILHHLSGHPNIVNIKGAYEDTTHVYLVMELCAGGELFDRIVKRGHYSERQARDLIRTIMHVVETCHVHGVMHRDLKPENFLFASPEEEAPLKTIDFGLSVFFKPGDVFRDVVGSPYYVAPEVLRKRYGIQADVWSAGVILYILLSGVPPFWAGKFSHLLSVLHLEGTRVGRLLCLSVTLALLLLRFGVNPLISPPSSKPSAYRSPVFLLLVLLGHQDSCHCFSYERKIYAIVELSAVQGKYLRLSFVGLPLFFFRAFQSLCLLSLISPLCVEVKVCCSVDFSLQLFGAFPFDRESLRIEILATLCSMSPPHASHVLGWGRSSEIWTDSRLLESAASFFLSCEFVVPSLLCLGSAVNTIDGNCSLSDVGP